MQLELIADPWFDGSTYDHCRDSARLGHELGRVWSVMLDGRWRRLTAIAIAAQSPEASVSARLRDLRKERFGSHTVERRYVAAGLWEYRVLPKEEA
jgi:hypothetical protein